jgi:hypothetical protein
MEEGTSYTSMIIQYLSEGFGNVNNPRGLIIALIATFFITRWRQVAPISILAVLVDFAARQMQPVATDGSDEPVVGTFSLPPLTDPALWREAGGLFFGYLIAIALFFSIKFLMMASANKTSRSAAH